MQNLKVDLTRLTKPLDFPSLIAFVKLIQRKNIDQCAFILDF